MARVEASMGDPWVKTGLVRTSIVGCDCEEGQGQNHITLFRILRTKLI